jgi:quercetin dioxygenase-like cupin family protein
MGSIGRLSEPAGVAMVRFHAGARNHWHVHPGGQVLHIVEGDARVQSWGGPVETLRPGDFAVADPGEKHWHGAAEGGDMAHVSIAGGDVQWLEPVTD